jgi:hypothetical protein
MAKSDLDQVEDVPTKKARLEAEAKLKADTYESDKAAEAAKAEQVAKSEAEAKLDRAEKEGSAAGLVKMKKGDKVSQVHPSAVKDHKKVGWEVY